jgi:tol-pal system protein YbgF
MRILGIVAGCLLLVGCGVLNQELVSKQLNDLNSRLVQMQKSQAAMVVNFEDLETRVFLVKDELDTYRKRAVRMNPRERTLPVIRIRPRETVQSTETTARRNGGDDYARLDEDRKPRARVERRPAARLKTSKAPAQSPTIKSPLPRSQLEAVRLYKASYALYKNNDYPKAIEGFRRFVEHYPTHGYADNAMYWMGECYYDRGLWMQALKTFQQVIQNYPLGNKVPDAMLKLGLCQYHLKNYKQAREILIQVTEIYPKSPVARIAKTRLSQIR